MKANPPLTEIDKAKLAKHARGPQAPMTVRVAVHPEQEADPDFLSSPQFEQQVKTQLASTLHDEHYLHPALADTFSLTGETRPSDLVPVAREWNKALGIDIAPAPKSGPVKEYDVGVTGPSKIVNQITGGED